MRRNHLYLGLGEMALLGARAGCLHAPGRGLGVVGKAGRRSDDQGPGYGLRASWHTFGKAISLGSEVAIPKPAISSEIVEIPNTPEHGPARELLG